MNPHPFTRNFRRRTGAPAPHFAASQNGRLAAPSSNRSVAARAHKLVLACAIVAVSGATVARAQTPGSVDLSFDSGPSAAGPGADFAINSAAVQSDGKVLLVGEFTTYHGISSNRVARLHPDGSIHNTFHPGADQRVFAVAVQSDGKFLVGGLFSSFHGFARARIARVNVNGTLDDTFNSGLDAASFHEVRSIVVQSDGKILIGGVFSSYSGMPRSGIARLNGNGTLDTTFNPGTGANSDVYSVALQSDRKVLIAGAFTSYNGTSRNRIARLNPDGTVDTSFVPGSGADGTVVSMAIQRDGKVLIGGDFMSYNGTDSRRLARLNADGSLDTTFSSGFGTGNRVLSVALQSDGKVLIGGSFFTYNGAGAAGVARLNGNGILDNTFNIGTGAGSGQTTNQSVSGVAVQSDGKVLVVGRFTSFGDVARANLVRLHNSPATEALTVTSPHRVQWLRGGAGAEVEQVAFERSDDGGTTWLSLGAGTRIEGGWENNGLNLPPTGVIRARGRTGGGIFNGSSAILERVASYVQPRITSISRLANGRILLQGLGAPNRTHSVEAFETLPPSNITTYSVVADPAGSLQFEDPHTAGFSKRFYRLTLP